MISKPVKRLNLDDEGGILHLSSLIYIIHYNASVEGRYNPEIVELQKFYLESLKSVIPLFKLETI